MCRKTAGVAPGSIIAAIIVTHTAANEANEPSLVDTPMFMPRISSMLISQHAVDNPRVTVSTAAVVSWSLYRAFLRLFVEMLRSICLPSDAELSLSVHLCTANFIQ